MTSKNKTLIAGPCSAESREQVLETARQISKIPGINYFRAGIWKPRTKPGSFEGVGEEGLSWMSEAKKEYGLKTCTEVANTAHVEAALKSGIDMIWIGARTTVSPFAVQEIADAIKGTSIPVLIKNPINPDIHLWSGAYERIAGATKGQIGFIHRGFSINEASKYRNIPLWELALQIKRLYPDSQLICDPSHISGARNLISEVSQNALDLDFDGLMIESHITPDTALSDAAQQVTPMELTAILAKLIMHSNETANDKALKQLASLRVDINDIDYKIIDLLAKRMGVVKNVGQLKMDNDLLVLQQSRFAELMTDRCKFGKQNGLQDKTITKIFEAIHDASTELQLSIKKAS